jgi:NTP pyrophosphatase (non-canonical NTP hydrolase)
MAARRPKKHDSPGQILLFPGPAPVDEDRVSVVRSPAPAASSFPSEGSVVISGSFRKDIEGLKRLYERFTDLHCTVLSPTTVDVEKEVEGFVYMRGEEAQSPLQLERRHLDAIDQADFVWLHAPEGYVGLSGSLEIGYATAVGTPVFCDVELQDVTLAPMVKTIDRPETLLPRTVVEPPPVPRPAVRRFQNYYRKVAIRRGYERESAQNCLLLMMEEIGELARGIRKDQQLSRDHGWAVSTTQELADVFIYVIHMANILNTDLGDIVQHKELSNWSRFLAKNRS